MLYKNEGSKNCKETQKKSTGRILSVPFEKNVGEKTCRKFKSIFPRWFKNSFLLTKGNY